MRASDLIICSGVGETFIF